MPATYSVNIGTQYETERKVDILSVLKELPDNTSKLITPRDVRDAFLTAWAASPIKQTKTITGVEYIGIDSGNPGDRDIKQKILLGKRDFGNLDVMSQSLLESPSDILIWNTRPDTEPQDSTTMGFIAGTNSSLFATAPYIGSSYNSSTNAIDFVVRNPQVSGGAISLWSSNGYVSLNGIRFPRVSDNTNATNGKILRYVGNFPNGYLSWSTSDVTISQLGSPDKITNIYGGTVSLNGYELEFVSPDMTPTQVGGVPQGFSFSATSFNGGKWPLSEVLRKLLYPKVPPVLTATASVIANSGPYVEIGTTSSVSFNWGLSLYARNSSEYISDYVISTQEGNNPSVKKYSGLSFSGTPGKTFSGNVVVVAASYSLPKTTNVVFSVSDTGVTASSFPSGFSYSATASVYHIWPIYYGFTQSLITDTATFNTVVKGLNKVILPYPGLSASISLNYSGTGYFYFIHQNSFDTLSKVYDPNGFLIHDSSNTSGSFFSSVSTKTGMTTNGQQTQWKVWVSGLTCSYSGNNNFVFKF